MARDTDGTMKMGEKAGCEKEGLTGNGDEQEEYPRIHESAGREEAAAAAAAAAASWEGSPVHHAPGGIADLDTRANTCPSSDSFDGDGVYTHGRARRVASRRNDARGRFTPKKRLGTGTSRRRTRRARGRARASRLSRSLSLSQLTSLVSHSTGSVQLCPAALQCPTFTSYTRARYRRLRFSLSRGSRTEERNDEDGGEDEDDALSVVVRTASLRAPTTCSPRAASLSLFLSHACVKHTRVTLRTLAPPRVRIHMCVCVCVGGIRTRRLRRRRRPLEYDVYACEDTAGRRDVALPAPAMRAGAGQTNATTTARYYSATVLAATRRDYARAGRRELGTENKKKK